MKLSTHRAVQLADMADRASSERVRCYCNAIKAGPISNHTAAQYFTARARQWEQIRIRAVNRLTEEAA